MAIKHTEYGPGQRVVFEWTNPHTKEKYKGEGTIGRANKVFGVLIEYVLIDIAFPDTFVETDFFLANRNPDYLAPPSAILDLLASPQSPIVEA